ncbi:hypothetical protein C8F04DRAFT_964160, partial [Mycena alexandri]
GMTQYLAKVQGMPPSVETKLERRIQNFLWDDKKTVLINKETVYAPIEMGAQNLLDIIARNKAITTTWLKSFLDFGPSRPLWAFATDEYMALNLIGTDNKVVDATLRPSVFLQAWESKQILKPKELSEMMKVARRRGVSMDSLALSREVMREATIWCHIKSTANRGLFNRGTQITCLKANHKVKTVGDAEILARRRTSPGHRNSTTVHATHVRKLQQNLWAVPIRTDATARQRSY